MFGYDPDRDNPKERAYKLEYNKATFGLVFGPIIKDADYERKMKEQKKYYEDKLEEQRKKDEQKRKDREQYKKDREQERKERRERELERNRKNDDEEDDDILKTSRDHYKNHYRRPYSRNEKYHR